MHRRLAEVIDESELRAQASGAGGDHGRSETAAGARRGGGYRRTRGAHLRPPRNCSNWRSRWAETPPNAGSGWRRTASTGAIPGRARALLEKAIAGMQPGPSRAEARHTLAIVRFIDDGYAEAVQLLSAR